MTQPIFSGAPTPVQGVTGGPGLPQGVASVDGGTGNVVISPPNNTIQIRKVDSPQALQLYEYYHSNTDFARVALNSQTNGPFLLQVETQPPAVIRDLQVNSIGSLSLTAGGNLNLTSQGVGQINLTSNANLNILAQNALNLTASTGHVILTATAAATFIIFKTTNTDRWYMNATGMLYPATDNTTDLGQASNRIRNLFLIPAAFTAGARYLVLDATGQVRLSAVGPAS